MEISKSKILLIAGAIIVFIFSFIIYLATLAPDIVFGDSADLIMSAYSWGVPHPPGYPLLIILAKIFSFLPFRNMAFRFNLFAALLASFAAILNFFVVVEISPREQHIINKVIPAASASLLFSFSYAFWSHSIIAEFVSLEILLLSALILLSLKWIKKKGTLNFYAAFFLYGLAVSHRPTFLFLAPAFLYLIISFEPETLVNIRRVSISLACALLGLIPYLYIPISAARNPLRNWGDTTTITNFWSYITAAEYKGHFQFFPSTVIIDQLTAYFSMLIDQLIPALLILVLLGIYWIAVRNTKILLFFLLLFFLNFAYAVNVYQISELLLYLPGFLIMVFLIGLGLNVILNYAKTISSPLFFATALLVAILPLILIGKNFNTLKNKNKFFAHDFAQNVLKSLDKNALLIYDGDNLFPIEYLHFIENIRPDVTLVSKRSLQKIWYLDQLKLTAPELKIPNRQKTFDSTLIKLITENIENHPVYLSNIFFEVLPFFNQKYEGMLFRLQPGRGKIIVQKTDFSYSYREPRTSIEDPDYFSLLALWQPELNLLSAYLANKEPEKAIAIAKKLQQTFPESALFSFELAEVYRNWDKNSKALKYYKDSLRQDPLFGDSYVGLAAIHIQEKNHLKALEMLEKSVVHHPNNPALRYYLAQIYEMAGNKKLAIKNWGILLKLETNPAVKEEASEHLRRLKNK